MATETDNQFSYHLNFPNLFLNPPTLTNITPTMSNPVDDQNSSSPSPAEAELDDDHPALISRNTPHQPFSFFRVSPLSFHPHTHRKRYYYCALFAISLPLLIIIFYFLANLSSNLFTGVASVGSNYSSDSILESELRVLYLLRQQRLGLLRIWDRSLKLSNLSNLVGLSSSSIFEDLKFGVSSQLSLNNEIERVILSKNRGPWPFSDLENVDNSSNSDGYERCRKVEKVAVSRKSLEWKPREDKYLFAVCVSGKMSNHLICLEKHMFFAAVLGRVLVIPSSRVDYNYNRVIDIEHVNKCVGRRVVVTFEEFEKVRKGHLHIGKFICYFSLPTACYVDGEHLKKLKSLGISVGKIETPWIEDNTKPRKRTVKDVKEKLASDENVIAIGDVFYADVERGRVMQPGGPLAHTCKTLVKPSRLIMLTAQRFIQTFLGKNFIALHFRRHGFLKFCNAKNSSCFFPVSQAAECINRVVERSSAPVIYLSTDAAESETSLLQSLIIVNGKAVPLMKRPSRNSAEKWDALLYRHGLEKDPQVEAMLDKTISAMSNVFIGSSGSTFTEDILRLRKDWGSSSLCDEYLCQGELPNFIADDE